MKVTEGRFTKRDRKNVAEQIIDTYTTRKNNRKELEEDWDDIDRQLAMRPDKSLKLDANGRPDKNMAWMPEIELPLQSQSLEITTADARRMQFPDSGEWFVAHSLMSDSYLDRADFQAIITGDEMEVPTQINQDNADKLVQGVLNHFHRQYPFFDHYDLINAEAIKYGMGVGRGRMVQKKVFSHTSKGVVPDTRLIPVIFPRSIRDIYLDDNPHTLMNEGVIVGGAIISKKTQRWEDLMLAAKKGGSDPNKETGGWMAANIKNIEKDKLGNVDLLEWEGDMIVPRKTVDSLYVPNVIVTVAMCGSTRDIVRLRFKKESESSYILHPYHREGHGAYPTSPLMKGRPIQKAAVEALSRAIMAAQLSTQPPVSYPEDDVYFKQTGGPQIYPGASWPTTGEVKPHLLGRPSELYNIYIGLLQQYSDVTGVSAPRLGAQTVSHTTAFAKEAELSRGTIRTVDYVKSTLKSGLEKWLYMEYKMIQNTLKKTSVYLDAYGGYVDITKNILPDEVVFEVHGSGGPAEEQAKVQNKLQAMQQAFSIEQLRAGALQAQIPTLIDYDKAIVETLRTGGWTDVDAITRTDAAAEDTSVSEGPLQTAPGAALGTFDA